MLDKQLKDCCYSLAGQFFQLLSKETIDMCQHVKVCTALKKIQTLHNYLMVQRALNLKTVDLYWILD